MVTKARDFEARLDAGWKMLTGVPCPLRVLGKRCLRYSGYGFHDCICNQHHHILDHGRLWHDPEGELVLVSEPYSFTSAEAVAYIKAVEELGLEVSFSGCGAWHPHTISVMVRRPT